MGITLASETVDAKSNEIPVVQGLLKKMDIEGCLIVADALNCQQKTAEIIVEGKGDYLLDAKGNQPSLEAEISEYVRDDLLRNGMDSAQTREKKACWRWSWMSRQRSGRKRIPRIMIAGTGTSQRRCGRAWARFRFRCRRIGTATSSRRWCRNTKRTSARSKERSSRCTLDGISTLRAQGVEKLVFVTKSAKSTFALADLLGKGSRGETYKLTHDGKTVTFTLGTKMTDVSDILEKA